MLIPYGRQFVEQDDIDSILEILKSDFLTQGPIVPKFEEALATKCGAQFAVASNSGTSSLHLACMALGVTAGDIVWTSSISFVASANAALYCSGHVDFVDINKCTFNLDPDLLKLKLEQAERFGQLPKVLIVVHLGGSSCEMVKIFELSRLYNFKIIEDASHALGGTYKNKPVGSCEHSDICVFSFHPVKSITTGEGGAGLTNSSELRDAMLRLRTHGVENQENSFAEPNVVWDYKQKALGYNYRLSDIHACLGVSQLNKLEKFIKKRNQIAAQYDKELSNYPLHPQMVPETVMSSYHLYIVKFENRCLSKSRNDFIKYMRARGIVVKLHYSPIYLHPFYQNLGFKHGLCPNAEVYFSLAISLPIFPTLSEGDQHYIIECTKRFFDG